MADYRSAAEIGKSASLLTFAEACELLSISPVTGRNWVRLGKLSPVKEQEKQLFFSRSDLEDVLHSINTGNSQVLKRRRNKKQVNRLSLYESYISDANNMGVINQIITTVGSSLTQWTMRSMLANFALQLICDQRGYTFSSPNLVNQYLNGSLTVHEFDPLIDDLLGDKDALLAEIDVKSSIYERKLTYVEDDDTLGFAYISLVNLRQRKSKGTYYTPLHVVKKLVSHLKDAVDISGKNIFDPCCGSGNFLLEIGKHTNTPRLLYGQDVDPVAICLARISFALKFGISDLDFLYSHFTCTDTFNWRPQESFDIVLGNPPWGGHIPQEKLQEYARNYKTAQKNSVDTFSLFTEHSLNLLSEDGILAFVLPEAILNVKAHRIIRDILLKEFNFKFVHYLGEVFSDVYCPSIILGVQKSKIRVQGTPKVFLEDECYSLKSDRQLSVEQFNFRVKDEVQDCLDALVNNAPVTTLYKQAKFALGIVTGNNAAFVTDRVLPGYEPVLKGSQIKRYKYEAQGAYLKFEPENFQQVAPVELYRAPEKLLYRFICDSLVFAYDNQQILSLNSCNILIPEIPATNTKYVLAILNSRAAGFYSTNMFSSVKVLRRHIEQIPIPQVSTNKQEQIVKMVDLILTDQGDVVEIYEELDRIIMSLYQLSSKECEIITNFMAKRNLFLP